MLLMEYSQEHLNYFRLCYIGFDLVPAGLRQIFKNEWDFLYNATSFGEWKDTGQNGRDFYNKESKKSRKKNARYLTTIQSGNTAEWDSSCLFFAILYSDSIGATLSPAVKKEVDDIRQVRNEIAHITEAKLTDADLQTSVDRLLNAFTSLGLAITEIQDIKNQTTFPTEEVKKIEKQARDLQTELDQTKSVLRETKNKLQSTETDLVSSREENNALTQEINAKLQAFCFFASRPQHGIVRRSHDIERITKKLKELHSGAYGAVSTLYLSGNPGCGKSQLAREIGEQFFSERTDKDVIFVATLNAESIQALADSYILLGRKLGLTEYTMASLASSKEKKPIEAIQQLLRLILPMISKFTSWMIIADNVVDLRLVRNLLPHTGSKEWGPGQVLITTQDSPTIPQNAPHTHHESLSKGMRRDEAVKLLETVSQISEKVQAEKVAELLDFQPLALAAAAYYVQTVENGGSSNYDWQAYLHDISSYGQRKEIEAVLANESPAYDKTTMAAVEMAIQRAVYTEEVLRQTFCFLALCAPDDLPLQTVSRFVKAQVRQQPEELIKAKIVRSSLILVHSEEGDERPYLRLHKVVHETLKRGEMFNLKSMENDHNMAEAVKIFKSEIEEQRENNAFLIKLRPHCESLLRHMTSDFSLDQSIFCKRFALFVDLDIIIDWLGTFASVCQEQSHFFFAKTVVDLACNLLENKEDTLSTPLLEARIFNVSGTVYRDIGEYSLAKDLHKKAVMLCKEICGEDHSAVASSYNNLALVYNSLGEYNQAKELYEKALVIWNEISSEDNPTVAKIYSNLALVHHSLGEYNLAKVFHEKALMIQKRTLGEDHNDVATSYNKLALLCDSLGEYNLAKELNYKALIIWKNIFGEDHAKVATSFNNLALISKSLGEYNQAKEGFEKAMVIWKNIFGEDHPNVATSYNNLALVYQELGNYNHAKKLFEKALMIRKKHFPGDHTDVATSYNNLASVYNNLGEYNVAKELYKKALIIWRNLFGEDHVKVATGYNNLALVYHTMGENNQAKELHEKALVILIKIFSEDHSTVAKSYSNLALVHYSLGEYNLAKKLHEKALMIRKKILSEDHDDVVSSYNNLATVCYSLGEYTEAKDLYEKALIIWRNLFGEDHVKVATSYNNLALVYEDLGDYNQGKKLIEKALVIRKKILGDYHTNVAKSYNDLATVCYSLGEYIEAKQLYEKALMIWKNLFGEDHVKVATSYNKLALVYHTLGENNQAKELFEKALIIRKITFAEDHNKVKHQFTTP